MTKISDDPLLSQIFSVAVLEERHLIRNKAFCPSNKYLFCSFQYLKMSIRGVFKGDHDRDCENYGGGEDCDTFVHSILVS